MHPTIEIDNIPLNLQEITDCINSFSATDAHHLAAKTSIRTLRLARAKEITDAEAEAFSEAVYAARDARVKAELMREAA